MIQLQKVIHCCTLLIYTLILVIKSKNKLGQFKHTSGTSENMIHVYKNSIKSLESELSNLEKQKNSLHDFLERGIYDIDTYLERSNNISERIKATNDEIESTSLLLD